MPLSVKLQLSIIHLVLVIFFQKCDSYSHSFSIVTLAGSGNNGVDDDGPATSAWFNYPMGIWGDTLGNLYVADRNNYRIRKVFATGSNITTIYKTGTTSTSPYDVWVDTNGANLYVTITGASTVIKIVLASLTSSTYCSGFSSVFGIWGDSNGVLYVGDDSTAVIWKITASNTKAHFLGTESGSFGTAIDIQATSESIWNVRDIWGDTAGNVYVYAENVYKVNSTGFVVTVAGRPSSFKNTDLMGSDGTNLYLCDTYDSDVVRIPISSLTHGYISSFAHTKVAGVSYTSSGRSYFYSGDNGPATSAYLYNPEGSYVDSNGNIYISDSGNNVIRKVSSGIITTYAGTNKEYGGDGGPASEATIYQPRGIWKDSLSNIYFCDSGNFRIRLINSTTNLIHTFAGSSSSGTSGDNGPATSASFSSLYDIYGDTVSAYLYVVDSGNCVIRRINFASNIIARFAGTGSCAATTVAGAATSSALSSPRSVYCSLINTNCYITTGTYIYKVTASGSLSVLVGNGGSTNVENVAGTSTGINTAWGIRGDSSGNLYYADNGNARIRQVTIGTNNATNVHTIAGGGSSTSDATIAGTTAQLGTPAYLWINTNINYLYFVDQMYCVVKSLSLSSMMITTIAGIASEGCSSTYLPDASYATSTQLNAPAGITGDHQNDLYISEGISYGGRIRKLTVKRDPTSQPASQLTKRPSMQPTAIIGGRIRKLDVVDPTSQPTSQPTKRPSMQPTAFIGGSLKQGLVAYYPFDGNANDESGNGNNGVVYSATLTNNRFGSPNSAYDFIVGSNPIQIPGDQFNFVNNMSVSLWINPSATQPAWANLVDKSHYIEAEGSVAGFVIQQNSSNTNSYFFETVPQVGVTYGSNAIQAITNQWNHLVFTKMGTALTCYYNGIFHGTKMIAHSNIIGNGNAPLIIGEGYAGAMDDIMVFNRTLTAVEVEEMFMFSTPTSRPSSQPTGVPSVLPSDQPSTDPTNKPSIQPTGRPSSQPTDKPSRKPSNKPSSQPMTLPSSRPTQRPTCQPTSKPSTFPSSQPNSKPSSKPSNEPSPRPSAQPSSQPSDQPSSRPSNKPSSRPSIKPTAFPSSQPNSKPSSQPSCQPSSRPSARPSSQPSDQPSARPSSKPSSQPSFEPSSRPSARPSSQPSDQPSSRPSSRPSSQPSFEPSSRPSARPSSQPSDQPSSRPSNKPSSRPSIKPTAFPSSQPNSKPSSQPSCQPSSRPSAQPSSQPSDQPSAQPRSKPSSQPSFEPSSRPSARPSAQPSSQPSSRPSSRPSSQPSFEPSSRPSARPSSQPSDQPSFRPSNKPSSRPSIKPTAFPSSQPNSKPSSQPSCQPSSRPSAQPSSQPSDQPSAQPSSKPSSQPSFEPSSRPSARPSAQPSSQPSSRPSNKPSSRPSIKPTAFPSSQPNSKPSSQPSCQPSSRPSAQPSSQPSDQPSARPSSKPSSQPSFEPSSRPSARPSSQPSDQPSSRPSNKPSSHPSFEPSSRPSARPFLQPTAVPSNQPNSKPSSPPTIEPTQLPRSQHSSNPSSQPSYAPSARPSSFPFPLPSSRPTYQPSSQPSNNPSSDPTVHPYSLPTTLPSSRPSNLLPSAAPSTPPSSQPSARTSLAPISLPSVKPSVLPSRCPSSIPSAFPSRRPSVQPSGKPTFCPVSNLSALPSGSPAKFPSNCPSSRPIEKPTSQPSENPTGQPTRQPISRPSVRPRSSPSAHPSALPISKPSSRPSVAPSSQPSNQPSSRPTNPTSKPSSQPSPKYSRKPTFTITRKPTGIPSLAPSLSPTLIPTASPTFVPSAAPTMFLITATSNATNWKEVLSLIGIYASREETFKTLDIFPPNDGSSTIIFGSKASTSYTVINAGPLSNSHYAIAEMSPSYKRDTTSRASLIPGDLNQDGFNDLIVCSPLTSICYIFFGNKEGLTNVMIGVSITGLSTYDFFGFALASVGDMNGDGYNDLLISALNGGACYVIYGRSSWSRSMNIGEMEWGGSLGDAAGQRIVADSSIAMMGLSVGGLGDINGDDNTDIAISVITTSSSNNNVIYVIYGSGDGGIGDINLGQIDNAVNGFRIYGEEGYYTGFSISGIGDFNADRFSDLIIGAIPFPGAKGSQVAFVIFGAPSPREDLYLGTLRAGEGLQVIGGGFIVSGIGDINSDGLDDVMVTKCTDYAGQINSYIVAFPASMTSPPSLLPSSSPSSYPSDSPSCVPSTYYPSHLPFLLSYSPAIPSVSNTSNDLISPKPTATPIMQKSRVPSMQKKPFLTSLTPSEIPTYISTSAPSSRKPTLLPSKPPLHSPSKKPSRSPTVHEPSSSPSFSPTSKDVLVFVSLTVTGNVDYSKISSNLILKICGTGTIHITGGSGQNIYSFLPPSSSTSTQSSVTMKRYDAYLNSDTEMTNAPTIITILNFNLLKDTLDLSDFPTLHSVPDVSFTENPFTIIIKANYKIILSSHPTLNPKQIQFKFFPYAVSSTSSDESLSGVIQDPTILVPLILLVICGIFTSVSCWDVEMKKEEEKKSDDVILPLIHTSDIPNRTNTELFATNEHPIHHEFSDVHHESMMNRSVSNSHQLSAHHSSFSSSSDSLGSLESFPDDNNAHDEDDHDLDVTLDDTYHQQVHQTHHPNHHHYREGNHHVVDIEDYEITLSSNDMSSILNSEDP